MQTSTTCKNCGSVLVRNRKAKHFCDKCHDTFEDKFDRIKEYIQTHPDKFLVEVAMEFEIPVSCVKDWLREERIQMPGGSIDHLFCEKCGAELQAGHYCERCKEALKDREVYESFMKELERREQQFQFHEKRICSVWVDFAK